MRWNNKAWNHIERALRILRICKRNYNVTRVLLSEAVWIVGGVCRETKEVLLVKTKTRNEATLTQKLPDNVYPGTKVITDCWRGYLNIDKDGYYHAIVNTTSSALWIGTFTHKTSWEFGDFWSQVFPSQYQMGTKIVTFLSFCANETILSLIGLKDLTSLQN